MVWGVIASLEIGNVILLILNLPLIPLWVRIINMPRRSLMTVILPSASSAPTRCNSGVVDVGADERLGVVGYVLRKAQLSPRRRSARW